MKKKNKAMETLSQIMNQLINEGYVFEISNDEILKQNPVEW